MTWANEKELITLHWNAMNGLGHTSQMWSMSFWGSIFGHSLIKLGYSTQKCVVVNYYKCIVINEALSKKMFRMKSFLNSDRIEKTP